MRHKQQKSEKQLQKRGSKRFTFRQKKQKKVTGMGPQQPRRRTATPTSRQKNRSQVWPLRPPGYMLQPQEKRAHVNPLPLFSHDKEVERRLHSIVRREMSHSGNSLSQSGNNWYFSLSTAPPIIQGYFGGASIMQCKYHEYFINVYGKKWIPTELRHIREYVHT